MTTGTIISEEQNKIFELYEEINGTMVTKEGGVSTGLSRETLKKIVEALSFEEITGSKKFTIDRNIVAVERSTKGKLRVAVLTEKDKLGEGSFGIVYRVIMLSSGKFKAMKIAKTELDFDGTDWPPQLLARRAKTELIFESKILRRLSEGMPPNSDLKEWLQTAASIVFTPTSTRTEEAAFYVTRICQDAIVSIEKDDGLIHNLEPSKRKSFELTAFEKHMELLIYLKGKNIYNNDIKLENMLVREKKGQLYLALSDFGGALEIKDLKDAVKRKDTKFNINGSPCYMPINLEKKLREAIKEGNEEKALFYNERINLFALAFAHYRLRSVKEPCEYRLDNKPENALVPQGEVTDERPLNLSPDFDKNLISEGYSRELTNLLREMLDFDVDYDKDKGKGFEYFHERLQKLPK